MERKAEEKQSKDKDKNNWFDFSETELTKATRKKDSNEAKRRRKFKWMLILFLN